MSAKLKKYDLKENIENEIVALATKYKLQKVILFGSRARGDNLPHSDIDLAVKGGNVAEFIASIDDEINTLLMFDVVNLNNPLQSELLNEIRRDGVELYEKV